MFVLKSSIFPELLNFTRCVRPNGTAYGTAGACRLGVESQLVEKKKRGRPKKVRKAFDEMSVEEQKAELERRLKESVKELRKQDPKVLIKQWIDQENAGIIPNKLPSGLKMAKDLALKKVSQGLRDKTPGSTFEREQQEVLSKLGDLYEKIRKIKEAKLPSGEQDWRVEEVERQIFSLRKRGLEGADKEQFKQKDNKLSLRSKTPEELRKELGYLKYELSGLKLAPPKEKEDKVNQLWEVISRLPSRSERLQEKHDFEIEHKGKKVPLEGSLKETLEAGDKFMKKHEEKLKSYSSLINRANALELNLREKLNEEESIKGRIRLKKVIFGLSQRRGLAESKFISKMEEIRNEMLNTKLSDLEIENLVNRVKLLKGKGSQELEEGEESSKLVKTQLKEFARMFNGKGLEDARDDSGGYYKGLKTYIHDPSVRAHAFGEQGQITSNGSKHTLFHEVGHIVEAQRYWLSDHASSWRDKRAFSKEELSSPEAQRLVKDVPYSMRYLKEEKEAPVFRLKEMIPLRNFKYEPNELAVVDSFLSPYLGKMYGDDPDDKQMTEIVSSLTEHFSDSTRMVHLYKKHPDLFRLGAGLTQTQ